MILKGISGPNDLKKISKKSLPEICQYVRDIMIETVSNNGGHLAPSLGVVELTVALHYVFDSPNDKIVWDVGHQAYAHKILTGRRDEFSTLRKKGGISGFPKPSESDHDAFATGHSSTSISAASGIAHAMKLAGSKNRAIAVIGDGSMTGGLAFEGMNQAGHKLGNLVVILNDNEMSISPNVGALSRFLSTKIHGKTAKKWRRRLDAILEKFPIWGKKIHLWSQRAEEATMSFLTPGALFEAFGFDYIGPLDGHNINTLTEVFDDIRSSPLDGKPVLVHVLTKKGKGYAPAEINPTSFHGTGPFDKESGKVRSSGKKSYTEIFSDAMLDLGAANSKVVAITAAMSTGTGLEAFSKKYPDRFIDVGIAEGHAVTFAAGLAKEGWKPVVAVYSTFLQRAYDHIMHDVCLQNLPVVFAIDRAGFVGDDGPTHHGAFDVSYLRPIPNLTLMAPRSGSGLKEMLKFAADHNGPVAIRYPRGEISEGLKEGASAALALGRAEIVYESKTPQLIVWALGNLVSIATEAAELLALEGINVTVVDPRFVKPFDFDLFKKLSQVCPNTLTIEEGALSGGFGSMIAEYIAQEKVEGVNLRSVGIPDLFIEHATQGELRAKYGLDVLGIVRTAKEQVHGVLNLESKAGSSLDGVQKGVSSIQ